MIQGPQVHVCELGGARLAVLAGCPSAPGHPSAWQALLRPPALSAGLAVAGPPSPRVSLGLPAPRHGGPASIPVLGAASPLCGALRPAGHTVLHLPASQARAAAHPAAPGLPRPVRGLLLPRPHRAHP